MVKRKGKPQRATEEKRQCMTWNMLEGPMPGPSGQGSLSVLPDNDPSLLHEIQEAETNNEIRIQGSSRKKNSDIDVKENQEFSNDDLGEMFNLFLEDCAFYVSLHNKSYINDGQLAFEVGTFGLRLVPRSFTPILPEALPQCKECWLYVSNSHESMLYFELNENEENIPREAIQKKRVLFWCVQFDVPIQVLQSLRDSKCFQCIMGFYDNKEKCLQIILHGTETTITTPAFPSEPCTHKRQNSVIQSVVGHFFSFSLPSYCPKNYTKKHNIERLYENVKSCHDNRQIDHGVNVQHPALRPLLRPYQRRGVNWMLEREQFKSQDKDNSTDKELHMLYNRILTPDGTVLYFNKYGGSLTRTHQNTLKPPPGGILADEMGLGKTVEVLACMLLHKRMDMKLPAKKPVLKDEDEMFMSDESSPGSESTRNSFSDLEILNGREDNLDIDSKSGITDLAGISDCNMIQSDKKSTSETEDSGKLIVTKDSKFSKVSESSSIETDAVKNESFDVSEQRDAKESTHTVNESHDVSEQGDESIETVNESHEVSEQGDESIETVNESHEASEQGDESIETVNESYESFPVNSDSHQSLCNAEEKSTGQDTPVEKRNNENRRRSNKQRRKKTCFSKKSRRKQSLTKNPELTSTSEKSENTGQRKTQSKVTRFVEFVAEESFQPKNIFCVEDAVAPKKFFECICGSDGKKMRVRGKRVKHKVQCAKCGLWQHAECVNYDLNDPYRGEFMCPHCHVSSTPISSGATLIISPSSICHQWVDEILKHVKEESLKVFVYTGVSKLGFIQPMTLAQQDIVITTYETLRSEINYVDLPHSNSESGRKFRHPKRFMAIPSPITAVEWWRICLDEAQMVECTTTKTAEMALRLKAINKWCVTGTPIQKSIEDLYGLLLFLGVDPFWVQVWWKKLVYEPFCYGIEKPMFDLVSSLLWRTAKKDVLDQINIPAQTEHVHWLTFSPVEDHFYRRQYGTSVQDYMKKLSKWNDTTVKLSSLDRHTLSQLMYPLLRLRQACCHPQAVRGEFVPLHLNRSAMTMEDLLESLTKKAKIECEEAHRQLVAAYNGLAGWHIIKEQYVDAVDKYREVLRSVEEHKDQLRTDDLQLLHAMYNLNEILSSKPEGVGPTLRDGQLEGQIAELKEKYMLKARTVVTNVQHHLFPIQRDIQNLKTEFQDGTEWWVEVIEIAVSRGTDEVLIESVKGELMKDHVDDPLNPQVTIARSFNSARGLQYILHQRMTALETAYDKLLQEVNNLSGDPSTELINETVDCCLRPVEEVKNSCPFCKVHKLFEDYESKLFSFKEQGLMVSSEGENQVNTRRQGTWADSELERTLKSLLSFAKTHYMDIDTVEYGQVHVKLLDTLKKEFKQLRIVWIELKAYVSSLDELGMATTRLRVRLPDEPKPNNTQMNILEPAELEQHKLKLLTDKTVGQNELRRKLGQLLYLKNLAKAQVEKKDGINPEPCPICQRELGKEWSVLQCGHCYCLDCIRILCEQYSFGGRNRVLKCAVCRQKTYHSDISYVSTVKSEQEKDEGLSVKGSHSTKVVGVVKCLKEIKRRDPNAKTLVFSTWIDVLNIIAQALKENDINYRTLYSGGKFQQNLLAFKERADISALLLPIHSGANGLNLIEATYVLLVEPVLNPAQELQAIGRVHRIGQSRPTQIHRFLIRGTIEQKMYTMLKAIENCPSSHNTEENTLTIGDVTSLFKEERDPGSTESREEEDINNEAGEIDVVVGTATAVAEEGESDKVINSTCHQEVESDSVESSTSYQEVESGSIIDSTNHQEVESGSGLPSTSRQEVKSDSAVASTSHQEFKSDSAVASTSHQEVKSDSAVASTSHQEVKSDSAVASTSHQEFKSDNAVASTSHQEFKSDSAVASTSHQEDKSVSESNQPIEIDLSDDNNSDMLPDAHDPCVDLRYENSPPIEFERNADSDIIQPIEIDVTTDRDKKTNEYIHSCILGNHFEDNENIPITCCEAPINKDIVDGTVNYPIEIEEAEDGTVCQPIEIEDTVDDLVSHPVESENTNYQCTNDQPIRTKVPGDGTQNSPLEIEDT